jgi:hypothetical protein
MRPLRTEFADKAEFVDKVGFADKDLALNIRIDPLLSLHN